MSSEILGHVLRMFYKFLFICPMKGDLSILLPWIEDRVHWALWEKPCTFTSIPDSIWLDSE